uniref:Uncharacterized protein n=1 Tax=Anguilla anguilla TaxID=7936 RepID=A0A0E9UC40_ANGAN
MFKKTPPCLHWHPLIKLFCEIHCLFYRHLIRGMFAGKSSTYLVRNIKPESDPE